MSDSDVQRPELSDDSHERVLPVEVVVRFRRRRLTAIVVAMTLVGLAGMVMLLLPWWSFSSPAGQMQIAVPGGGFRYVDIAGSHSLVSGREAGGWKTVAVLAVSAVVVALASVKRWWPVCWPVMLLLMPASVAWPSTSPPRAVAGKFTAGAGWTSATSAVNVLVVLFCCQLILCLLAGAQMFMVRRAEKVLAGETSLPLKAQGLIDRVIQASFARLVTPDPVE